MKVAEPFHLHGQMSDSFRAAVFIILSGGFQDAYTSVSYTHLTLPTIA